MPVLFVVLRVLELQSEGNRLPPRLPSLPSLMSKHSRARWPITAPADVMCAQRTCEPGVCVCVYKPLLPSALPRSYSSPPILSKLNFSALKMK